LTRPSSHTLKDLVFFWMAASKGGHDDGIGRNIRVIKSRKGEGLIWDRNTFERLPLCDPGSRFAWPG
ncbi:MAG: hypothetical protein WCF79_21135, partial [Rhodomicrobium sp.]